jgi:hypothetical protein
LWISTKKRGILLHPLHCRLVVSHSDIVRANHLIMQSCVRKPTGLGKSRSRKPPKRTQLLSIQLRDTTYTITRSHENQRIIRLPHKQPPTIQRLHPQHYNYLPTTDRSLPNPPPNIQCTTANFSLLPLRTTHPGTNKSKYKQSSDCVIPSNAGRATRNWVGRDW